MDKETVTLRDMGLDFNDPHKATHKDITKELTDAGFKVPDPCFEDDQLFTWIDPETQEGFTFNTTALIRMWVKDKSIGEVTVCLTDKHQIDWIRANRGIEQHRVDKMCEPYINMPIIGAVVYDQAGGEHLITIDGHHRMVKKWELGVNKLPSILFRKPAWEKCLIVPPKGLNPAIPEFSGIRHD